MIRSARVGEDRVKKARSRRLKRQFDRLDMGGEEKKWSLYATKSKEVDICMHYSMCFDLLVLHVSKVINLVNLTYIY
jgi:hypothetical protein